MTYLSCRNRATIKAALQLGTLGTYCPCLSLVIRISGFLGLRSRSMSSALVPLVVSNLSLHEAFSSVKDSLLSSDLAWSVPSTSSTPTSTVVLLAVLLDGADILARAKAVSKTGGAGFWCSTRVGGSPSFSSHAFQRRTKSSYVYRQSILPLLCCHETSRATCASFIIEPIRLVLRITEKPSLGSVPIAFSTSSTLCYVTLKKRMKTYH